MKLKGLSANIGEESGRFLLNGVSVSPGTNKIVNQAQ